MSAAPRIAGGPSRWRVVLAVTLAFLLLGWAWHARPATLSLRWHAGLVPGLALSFLSLAAYAARFQRVLRLLGIHFSFVEGLRIVSFAVCCQFFVPLGAGAELAKMLKLGALAPERRLRVNAAAIVLEHLLGLAAVVLLAGTAFALVRPFALHIDGRWLLLAGAAIVALATAVVLRLESRRGLDLFELHAALATHKSDAFMAMLWSMLMHVLLAGAVYVGSLGAHLAIGYGEILFVLTCAAVLQAIPANLVGLGVADVAGTGLYVALGRPLTDALLLVSLLYCYRLAVALAGGAWELWRAGRSKA